MNKLFRAAAIAMIGATLLGGCASHAINQDVVKRVEDTTLASGWRVDCTTDETLNVRQCFAGKFGKYYSTMTAPFQVYYFGDRGPFIMAGSHNDPTSRAVVRVGDAEPVILENINTYAYESTSAAHIADAKRVVSDLKKGGEARVRFTIFAEGSRDMTLNVDGFNEAYAKLMRLVAQ